MMMANRRAKRVFGRCRVDIEVLECFCLLEIGTVYDKCDHCINDETVAK